MAAIVDVAKNKMTKQFNEVNMKKFVKIAGGLLATGIGTWLIYRYFKRERAKLQECESNARQAAEEMGISYEKVKEEVTIEDSDEGNTFIKGVAAGMFFNSNVPIEYLNPDDTFALSGDEGGILHIAETTFNKRRYLDFLFELPNFVKGRFAGPDHPRINEYIREIKRVTEEINDTIVKGPRPLTKPELYVGVRFTLNDESIKDATEKNSNEIQSSYFLIPSTAYMTYATENHDGLADYYTNIVANNRIETEELKEELRDYINIHPDHYEITDVRVMIKSSFRIADSGNSGLTFLAVPRVIMGFIENTEVKPKPRFNSNNRGNSIRFEHVLFHPRVEDQEEQGELPCTIYEKVKGGKLIKSEYLI